MSHLKEKADAKRAKLQKGRRGALQRAMARGAKATQQRPVDPSDRKPKPRGRK